MNRRDFIKSLGIGVIAAPIVAKAASEPKPDAMTHFIPISKEKVDFIRRMNEQIWSAKLNRKLYAEQVMRDIE